MKMLTEVKDGVGKYKDVLRLEKGLVIEKEDDGMDSFNIEVIMMDDIHHSGIVVYGNPKLAAMIVELVNKELEKNNA